MTESRVPCNGLTLKCVGWLFTLCALAAAFFFPQPCALKTILTYLGYISLPIFAYLLVEGFVYCRSLGKYILTLGVAAVITEPFYDYFCLGTWLDLGGANGQNILFAMAVGLVQLSILRALGTAKLGRTVACVLMVLAACVWSFILNIPCGAYFQLMVGIFYLLHNQEKLMLAVAAALSLLLLHTPVLAIPLLYFYDGQRGSYNKYLFYIAYPLLWMAAAMVKLLA